jgi:hypothetical protein
MSLFAALVIFSFCIFARPQDQRKMPLLSKSLISDIKVTTTLGSAVQANGTIYIDIPNHGALGMMKGLCDSIGNYFIQRLFSLFSLRR